MTIKQRIGRRLFANMPITRFLFDQLRVEANAAIAWVETSTMPRVRRRLKDIKKGDEIVLSTSIGESRYRVTGWDIVLPTDTRSLDDTPNAVLNLVTCYPFYYVGNAPKRFIVHAEMAEPDLSAKK